MRHLINILVKTSVALLVCCPLYAQDDDSDKINTNMGAAVSFPMSPTSGVVKTSWGLTAGVGYNFSTHHSLIGEFMWSALYPSRASLEPIRAASNDNSINGHSNLYAFTGNYRYELQGKVLGTYFIGGGGWYFRTLGFSKAATSVTNTPCTAPWLWWGFTCSGGMVIPNQVRGSYNSSAFGGNVGVGFTVKVGDPNYRIYIEPRYHYAPTKNVTTQLLEVTVGIRY
jgi:hypothetical protein